VDKRVKSHAISSLRRGCYKWPGRWKAEKRSHVGRGEYLCESCGWITKKHNTSMDHIIPVVDPEKGWQGLDSFAERLFVEEDGWQRLCDVCHGIKTKGENLIRNETKKQAKKEKP